MVARVEIPSTDEGKAPDGHDEKMLEVGTAALNGDSTDVPSDEPATTPESTDVPTETDEPSQPDADADADAAEEALKGAGLDLSTYESEFEESGELSEDSYTALEKAGIPKAMVDQYIAGQSAVAANLVTAAHNQVGGEENYNAMVTWAVGALTPADKAVFNAANDKGGAEAKLAIAGLNAQYRAAQGSSPKLLGGFAPAGQEAVTGYRSTSELTTAMSDPRYSKDSAYRKDVETKLAASKLF
jgi:hypothetical protein